jgi:hypothetical protein
VLAQTITDSTHQTGRFIGLGALASSGKWDTLSIDEVFNAIIMLHIAQADVNLFESPPTTTLAVDEQARDLMELAAIRARNSDATDLSRRQKPTYRNSRQVEDRVALWDCEAGSGVIPRHGIQARLWNVLKIPTAELGNIVRTEFSTYANPSTSSRTPTAIAVGIFDRYTNHSQLRSRGEPTDTDYWDVFDETTGLIIAWGGAEQMGGYSPGLNSQGDPKTGYLLDNSGYYFQSQVPPWLWVALWCDTTCYIAGKLYPDANDAL